MVGQRTCSHAHIPICPSTRLPTQSGHKRGSADSGTATGGMTLEAERRLWVALAARALQQAGDRELAARLFESVASYKQARAMLAGMGQWARLADCCAAAAAQLRAAGREAHAVPWLAEDVRCHRLLVSNTGVWCWGLQGAPSLGQASVGGRGWHGHGHCTMTAALCALHPEFELSARIVKRAI